MSLHKFFGLFNIRGRLDIKCIFDVFYIKQFFFLRTLVSALVAAFGVHLLVGELLTFYTYVQMFLRIDLPANN